MKANYDFCKAYPLRDFEPDELNQRCAELGNFQTLADQFQVAVQQMSDYKQTLTQVDKLLTREHVSHLNKELSNLNMFVQRLLEAEPLMRRQIPDPNSLFSRNNQQKLCAALSQISNAFTTMEDYKEQLKLNRLVCLEQRDEIKATLEQAVQTVRDNLRELHEEALSLGLM